MLYKRNCMVGTFADVVIADAIVKGVTGFNIMMAKDALLKDVRLLVHFEQTIYIIYMYMYMYML